MVCIRRCDNRILQSGWQSGDLCRRRERSGRNRQSWLLESVGPGHDVGQRDVGFYFDLRWGNDGLRVIGSFARNRNDGLSRKLRISFSGRSIGWTQGVEWRKVFGRPVIDDLGMLERWFRLDPRPQGEQMRETNEESHRDHVIRDGLDEGVPRKVTSDENVWPELAQ